ncbi:MAG TPA: hypothetical protein DCG69_05345 [Bacteroidales bacterium]|nr:hypothetical protein [Bacteroidales bacterium]
MHLEEIFDPFKHLARFVSAETINTGHINATYFIKTDGIAPDYVLQKINSFVFKDIPSLIQNKVLLTEQLRTNTKESEKANVVQFVRAFTGDYYFKENENAYWNLMIFISRSRVYLKTPNLGIAKRPVVCLAVFFIC